MNKKTINKLKKTNLFCFNKFNKINKGISLNHQKDTIGICKIIKNKKDILKINKKSIAVLTHLIDEVNLVFQKAKAVVVERGLAYSYIKNLSKKMKKNCIQIDNATQILKDGMKIKICKNVVKIHKTKLLDGSPIVLTLKCNRNCIFCSRKKRDMLITLKKLKKLKRIPPCYLNSTLTIEGGEPLLGNEVCDVTRFFYLKGARDIMLMTNGALLDTQKAVRLMECGIKYFNINLPSHIKELFNLLTGTKNQFEKTIKNIKELTTITKNVVLTYVINKLNYKYLPSYVTYVSKNFPNISYISINMIKVLGKVKKNKWLVPKLSEIHPYLTYALKIAEIKKIKIIVDGIPLCFMKEHQTSSVDLMGAKKSIKEKTKTVICRKCNMKSVCSGVRKDYLSIYGFDELKENYFH